MPEDLTKKPANSAKSPNAVREEKILNFWNANQIFQKSLGVDIDGKGNLAPHSAAKGDFIFYDGPPFATGLPHFGHVLPMSIKDAVPRYKTMQGYTVRRRWGWDCHGLPVENLIEKELGLKTKKDILDYGIEKFNEAARASVLRYAHDWRTIIPRLGRWVDMDNDYETMNAGYTESVWWAFKTLYDKGLVSEGFKAMQLCPRCETTLANFEVNQGYKDITDISVYVQFELTDQPGTFFLAWTTTPWTLPGNAALAVGKDIEYSKIKIADETFILATDRLAAVFKDKPYEVLSTMKGDKLAGGSYKPVFDYYSSNKNLNNRANGWKVYAADFVTTTDGTGIVHIAPAFGIDDMELGNKNNLPFIQHVTMSGVFKPEVTDFAGQHVKPKDDHQKGDVEVIKYLAACHGGQKSPALFAKEKIIHSYPHCWRCETPLLNYATSSWFVKAPELKDKLVAENKKVNWTPEEVGQGRFGNWLLGARDWAISRSRFWGAPLPVWRTEEGEKKEQKNVDEKHEALSEARLASETVVIGSLADLKKYSRPRNTYFLLRHGEAENNTKEVISSKAATQHHLTDKGKVQVKGAAEWLADKKIDMIFVSPFVRTRETALIVAERLGVPVDKVFIEDSIHELNAGDYDGIGFREFISKFPFEKRFDMRPPDGENYVDIKKRMGDFLYGLEKKYSSKRILIITHDSPAFLLVAAARGLNREETVMLRGSADHFMQNAMPLALDFMPLPHNREYELDFHRPYIDEIELSMPMKNGKSRRLTRVPEVFDCWFESGSMPFGEAHYPFENKDIFDPKQPGLSGIFKKSLGYPADFIAEGQDQTRGWFYSMLVLGVALFGKSPYKNVIVNGLVLAEDGQKMSKSKGNFPDLMPVVDTFGADAIRFYLLSSPLVRAQEFAFSERGVDEVAKKHIGRLMNVVSFYEMYAGALEKTTTTPQPASVNPLDQWILARLAELVADVTRGMEKYEIDRATRPFIDFIDDLSTWYIRRSRDRFKAEAGNANKTAALSTTRTVLLETAKLLAPFMPFTAEDIYQRLSIFANGNNNAAAALKESVHLEEWPAEQKFDKAILADMQEVRRIASLALEARMKAKINVRQPLATLTVKIAKDDTKGLAARLELTSIILDEVNVKKIAFDETIAAAVELDTALTPELKEEGIVREFIRAIQDLRKEKGLTIQDRATLVVDGDAIVTDLIARNKAEISTATLLKEILFKHLEGEVKSIGELTMKLDIGN
jgi:isoleucyl-tRNA synthetase